MVELLNRAFVNLEDPRSARNQKHPFLSLIHIGLLSVIAGIDSFNGMAIFAECHEEELKKLIPLPCGAPSHDTIARLFDALEPNSLIESFMLFTDQLADSIEGLIALDGKTIKNSGKKGNPLHIVSAWSEENRLVLGHIKAKGRGGGEIEAVKELLALLDLENKIISLDALGCQKGIAKQIITKGGNYVLPVKNNQKALFDDIKEYFKDVEKFSGNVWEEWDKGHGRIEHRKCWSLPADDWLKTNHDWTGLHSVSMVKCKRIIEDKESEDIRFYISSLEANAENICKIGRRHWGIENKLHWVLDVVFNEDKACIRNDNAAVNIDTVRKWALNVINIQRTPKDSIRGMQRRASMSFKYLIQLLRNSFHA